MCFWDAAISTTNKSIATGFLTIRLSLNDNDLFPAVKITPIAHWHKHSSVIIQ